MTSGSALAGIDLLLHLFLDLMTLGFDSLLRFLLGLLTFGLHLLLDLLLFGLDLLLDFLLGLLGFILYLLLDLLLRILLGLIGDNTASRRGHDEHNYGQNPYQRPNLRHFFLTFGCAFGIPRSGGGPTSAALSGAIEWYLTRTPLHEGFGMEADPAG